MGLKSRFNYWQRVVAAYLVSHSSQSTFWHEKPEVNEAAAIDQLGQYYMTFFDKTRYPGPFDRGGIPLLNYHGKVGQQYNPIAIAQYGLGHYNLYKKNGDRDNFEIAKRQADWLVNNLEGNQRNAKVWMHHFDWESRDLLKAPWYSALAQGNGISLLTRLYLETKNQKYFEAIKMAFKAFLVNLDEGGVRYVDNQGYYWLEETILQPPTHVLNGFIWAMWGVRDYFLLTREGAAKILFDRCVQTLKSNLYQFDCGFWSIYEQAGTKLKMLASPFYHSLHIVQLQIMHKITEEPIFKKYADEWRKYQQSWLFKNFALVYKIIFKIFYY